MFKSPLTKIAIFGGVAVLGAATWMERRIQNNFRRQDYYQKAVLLLHKYEPAAHFLGRPIFSGRVNLGSESELKVDGVVAKLSIPLKGSKDRGVLHVLASREKMGDSWDIDQLDLEISSTKQRWKFYDRELALKKSGTETVSSDDVGIKTSESGR